MDYEKNIVPFGVTLKELLKQRNVKTKKLCEFLGVTRQSLSMYCNGKTMPEYKTLLKIAQFFNVSTDYLLTGKHSENTKIEAELNLPDSAIENLKLVAGIREHTKDKNGLAYAWFPIYALLSREDFYELVADTYREFVVYSSVSDFLSGKSVEVETIKEAAKKTILPTAKSFDEVEKKIKEAMLFKLSNTIAKFFKGFFEDCREKELSLMRQQGKAFVKLQE
ncbi:MAG: helix-turn-helix transcriptional regulator [Synergistaceae bacterium]|nr:helix-turn-helix transcriptional regulator [Synergistaceae bacterium]